MKKRDFGLGSTKKQAILVRGCKKSEILVRRLRETQFSSNDRKKKRKIFPKHGKLAAED